MPLYTRLMDHHVAMPTPRHALDPGAIEAVEMHRSLGYAKTVDRIMSRLVTRHGRPRIRVHDAPPSAGYARVKRLAEENGWKVTEYRSLTGHALQGRRGDLGFRAYWQWGKTTGASWHEREARWTLVADDRPVKMDKVARVGLKGYRSAGVGTTHLKLIATPDGLPINVTELEKRITS